MEKMAHAFNTTVANLEDELSELILDGQIQARIDSHNKVQVSFFTVRSHQTLSLPDIISLCFCSVSVALIHFDIYILK